MKYVEQLIVKRCIRDMLKAGYELGIHDGEEMTLKRCTNASTVFKAMGTTDEDHLMVYRPGTKGYVGWVFFVYGNDGWDVVNDYTTNLDHVMDGVNAYAAKFDS